MPNHKSNVVTSCHVQIGVRHAKLHVWVPSSDEIAALEKKYGSTFNLLELPRDSLGDALVRWRKSTDSAGVASASWGDGQFLSVPVPVVKVCRNGGYQILENAASVVAMLLVSPASLVALAALVCGRPL